MEMVRITRWLWSPDTCECQIYTLVDVDLPPEQQIETGVEIAPGTVEGHEEGTVRCAAHTSHTNATDHHKVVLEECQRKNVTHGHLSDGQLPMTWRWTGKSPNRVLHVSHSDAKTEKGNASELQKKLNDSLGAGKVVLHD